VKVGDLIKWSWHLDAYGAQTHFMGVIVGSKLYKMGNGLDKCIVFRVLDNTGEITQVREDEATLKLVSSP